MLLGTLILKIISLVLACAFTYQSYAAFRSARPKASVSEKNPQATSTRLGRILWGSASLAISLGLFFYLIHG